ncbi:MAG: DivIVA domain-containing protein, partial [Propionibacteriaceae bacterium]|nr:DivIVA domain-containing protein [Propionibacteriaceae bacterium]
MTMTPLSWIIVGVAVVVIGIVILVANRRMGGMPPVVDDRPGMDLPDTPLTGEDLKGVRFAIVSRGYSMGQVDALLDRLSGQLDGTPFQPTDEHESWLGQAPADNQEAAPGAHNRPPSTFEQPLVAAVPTSDAPAVPVEAPAQVDVPVVPPVETPAPWGAPPAPVVEAPARMDPVPLLPYVPFPPAPPAEPEMAAAEPEMTEAPIISGPIFVGQRAADEPSHKSVDEPSNGVDESSNLMGMGAVVVEPWAVDAPVQPEVPLPPAPPVDE